MKAHHLAIMAACMYRLREGRHYEDVNFRMPRDPGAIRKEPQEWLVNAARPDRIWPQDED